MERGRKETRTRPVPQSAYPDVSILEVGEHVLQGGNDYDRVIAEYLCRQLWPEPLDDTALHLADRKDVQSAMNRFWYSMILTAREIKEGISSEADTDLEVDLRDLKYFRERYLKSLRDVMGIPERTTVRLRSMEFDRVLSGLMGNPIGNTLFAGLKRLEERYMNGEHKALEPTGILLAGGGAQVNAVRKMLQERYPDAPIHKPRNPHYLIAQGAAAFAALPEEERDLWRWPINKDVYLKVEDQKNKRVIWDKIWSRERPEDEYDYTMPKSSERLEIILGAGFYDMEHNIDRITPQKPRTLSFHRQVRKQEPVKLRTWVDTLSARPYMKILLQEYGAWREACPDISLEVDIE